MEDIRRERQEAIQARKRAEMAEWVRQHDERVRQQAQDRLWQETLAKYRTIDVRSIKTPATEIIEKVAAFHGLPTEALTGNSRERVIIEARFDAIKAVADTRPDMSLTQIGKIFNRDHTSILHALKQRGGRTGRDYGSPS
jgi:chromosomal replication initiation ATPase DnaA